MSNATTVTLFVVAIKEVVGEGDFDAALPGYIARLKAALPECVTLEVDNYNLSSRSLRDDDDQSAAEALAYVEFWN